MKFSTLLTAGLYLVLMSRSLTVSAADPRLSGGYNTAPNRGLFGLPMPQQWSGARPMGMNGGASNYGYRQAGYNPNCPNGNCSTDYREAMSNCPNGQCSTGACANGQCLNGACASGNCPNGCCVNGQCTTGECLTGAYRGGNCPNGNCGTGSYTNSRYPVGAQSDWSPRSPRTGLADPYRRSNEFDDRNGWTQRTSRPVLAPLDDAFSSRYRQDDLNLRNEYFGNDPRSRMNSNELNRPSRRSLEAPAESNSSVARF